MIDITGHLASLDTRDCTCHYEIQSLGRLYGIGMGKGWVRLSTDPSCPHHANWKPQPVPRA